MCGAELFRSGTKFDSHCGWPSFYESIRAEAVELIEDDSRHGAHQVRCANCGSHLGHVFPTGSARDGRPVLRELDLAQLLPRRRGVTVLAPPAPLRPSNGVSGADRPALEAIERGARVESHRRRASHDELLRLVSVAGRVADHSSLQPWRPDRAAAAPTATARTPSAISKAEGDKGSSAKPLRAPLLVAIVATYGKSEQGARDGSRKASPPAWRHTRPQPAARDEAGWGVNYDRPPARHALVSRPSRSAHGLKKRRGAAGTALRGGKPRTQRAGRRQAPSMPASSTAHGCRSRRRTDAQAFCATAATGRRRPPPIPEPPDHRERLHEPRPRAASRPSTSRISEVTSWPDDGCRAPAAARPCAGPSTCSHRDGDHADHPARRTATDRVGRGWAARSTATCIDCRECPAGACRR